MGWNQLKLKKQDPLLRGYRTGKLRLLRALLLRRSEIRGSHAGITDHGIDFAAIVHQDNLWATQFHPEKSQKVGERLLDNFARI